MLPLHYIDISSECNCVCKLWMAFADPCRVSMEFSNQLKGLLRSYYAYTYIYCSCSMAPCSLDWWQWTLQDSPTARPVPTILSLVMVLVFISGSRKWGMLCIHSGCFTCTVVSYSVVGKLVVKWLVALLRFEGGLMEHSLRLSEGFAAVLELCDLMSTTREPW